MEMAATTKGGAPWNWVPVFDWEIQPNVWYTWADPDAGKLGRCLQKRGRVWVEPPSSEEAVVLRHHRRSRPRDQIGYLLCQMLPVWNITVGATGHDFVELAPPITNRLVAIQGRHVVVGVRTPLPDQPNLYRVVGELGPYKGRGWVTHLVIDVFEVASGQRTLSE
jgi:hypothetical protein